MKKTVVLVGAMDTKGKEFAFVKGLIERQGLSTLVVDFGVMDTPTIAADITREEVARAGGKELSYLRSGDHKDEAMTVMAAGLTAVVRRLKNEGRLDGILGMGGSGGTSISTAAMRDLPIGIPKVMVSTVGGGDVSAYAGSKDIAFVPSIVDVAGINRISQAIYANAAGAISGMVNIKVPVTKHEKPLITASMFGNTTKCVDHARGVMEKAGYEVLVFHATGSGGRTMESLISDGFITGSLDLTTTELADEVCGGVLSAGPDRMKAAATRGVPTVAAPGCVDMCNFWAVDTVPEKYRGRNLYKWNPNTTLMRTNVEENIAIGRMIANAVNLSKGKVAVLLPLKGVSMLDSPGKEFWDVEADKACFSAIKDNLKPGIPVTEVDFNINDPEFAQKAAELLLDMLKA
ncbi:MAG: Tm-1-like ATP-binding domain-containing protein [Spirochaetia bacterium]